MAAIDRTGLFGGVSCTLSMLRERHGARDMVAESEHRLAWLTFLDMASLGLERALCVVKVVTKDSACGDGAAGVGS